MLPNGDVIHAFADTPPHFTTRTAHQRVYTGADSYELLGRVSEMFSRIALMTTSSGTARIIPTIPHNTPQNDSDRRMSSGLTCSRRPAVSKGESPLYAALNPRRER